MFLAVTAEKFIGDLEFGASCPVCIAKLSISALLIGGGEKQSLLGATQVRLT